MQTGHGDADALLADNVDLELIDRVVASGGATEEAASAGVAEEAARMVMVNNFLGPKRFGKMFPDLDAFRPPREALEDLGEAMSDASFGDPALDNLDILAGFTYLGQFIDHDLTRDETRGFPRINDPELIEQARTPTLDLDSVYGAGPRQDPDLYDPTVRPARALFKIGSTVPTPDVNDSLPNDLPRRRNGKPIIGDDRNDENLVVAQTHLAFLKFHNRVIAGLPRANEEEDESATFTQAEEERKRTPFHRARRMVRWHYQWIVLNDFLPKIIDPSVLNDIRTNGRRFYDFDREPFGGKPFMPIEFSAGAYRLGHSMVRENYNYNRVFPDATLSLLFLFTHKGRNAPIPSNWVIDWRRFFEVGRRDLRNFARKLDTKLIPQLHQLPGFRPGPLASLAVRNLLRGSRIGLPAGQDVAEAMGLTSLTPGEIASGSDRQILRQHKFHQKTPLWYYILKEAEVQGEGKRLGAVGSRIVGEVFVGLLEGDKNSFLSRKPDWTPEEDELPSRTPGEFTMADLLRFVGEINPIGG